MLLLFCVQNNQCIFGESVKMFWFHIIIFLLAVAIYSNSLSGDFVHDDIVAIVRNPDVNWKQTSQFDSIFGESGNLWSLWKNDYWGMPMSSPTSHKSYRPLTVLTFRLNYWQCGDSLCPEIFHGTNVVIHGLVSVLTLYLCQHVLQLKLTTSLLASGLFAVHPIHTEAVAGITGRADALACLLMLTSFLLYHRCSKIREKFDEISDSQNYNTVSKNFNEALSDTCFQDKNHNECIKQTKCSESRDTPSESARKTDVSSSSSVKAFAPLMASGICGFAAMLAKETGISILGINLLYDSYLQYSQKKTFKFLKGQCQRESFFQTQKSSFKCKILSLAMLIVASLTFRFWLLNGTFPNFGRSDNPAAYSDSKRTRLLTFLYLPVFSAWLILCPSTLSYDWQMGSMPLIESLTDLRNLFTILFYGSLLTLAWKSIVTGKETGRVLTLSLLFTTLPFLPASNLFFHVGFVVAERVLYTPSLGVCIVVALGVERIGNWFTPGKPNNSKVLVFSSLVKCVCVLILLCSFGVQTWKRNSVWQSRESLFTSGIRDNPQNAKMHYNYANLQKDMGNKAKAIQHYTIAIRLWPEYASAHNNLGTLLIDNPAAAEYQFLQAINSANQAHGGAHFNLGVLYMNHQKFSEAASHFKKLLIIDPMHHQAFHYLNACLKALNNHSNLQKQQRPETERNRSVPPNINAIESAINKTNNISVLELNHAFAIEQKYKNFATSSNESFTTTTSTALELENYDSYRISKHLLSNLSLPVENIFVCRKLQSRWEPLSWPYKL